MDSVETMLIMALEGFKKPVSTRHIDKIISASQSVGGAIELQDQGDYLGLDDALPNSMFSFDMVDEDRLIATGSNDLLQHPKEILGDESQIVMLAGDTCKFTALRKISKPPKRLAILGKPDCFYELHFKFIDIAGNVVSKKRIVPFSKAGTPLLTKYMGNFVCDPRHEGMHSIICCSIIEDALRTNAMLATIKDHCEIKLPVPLDSYKEIFALREDPRHENGRRKAILHWVRSHLRKHKSGKVSKVDKFNRGIHEFDFDGLTVTLEPNNLESLIGATA